MHTVHPDRGPRPRPHRRDQQFWRAEALRTGLNRSERRRLRLFRWKPPTTADAPLGGMKVGPVKPA